MVLLYGFSSSVPFILLIFTTKILEVGNQNETSLIGRISVSASIKSSDPVQGMVILSPPSSEYSISRLVTVFEPLFRITISGKSHAGLNRSFLASMALGFNICNIDASRFKLGPP